MIMECPICAHTGEPEWRNEKRYCAVCGSELYDDVSEVYQEESEEQCDAICPICRNDENNRPEGGKYRCSLCGTLFDLEEEYYIPQQTVSAATTSNYNSGRRQELQKQKDNNITLGVIFLFLFWPVAIYFFSKAHKANKELKSYRY